MVTSSGILPLETLCSFLTFNFHLRNVNLYLRVFESVNTLPRNTSNHEGEKSSTSHSFSSVICGMGADDLMLKAPEAQRSRDFQQKKKKRLPRFQSHSLLIPIGFISQESALSPSSKPLLSFLFSFFNESSC